MGKYNFDTHNLDQPLAKMRERNHRIFESDDDKRTEIMNGNVNKRHKSTEDSIRCKHLKSINVNFEAKDDHISDDKEEKRIGK